MTTNQQIPDPIPHELVGEIGYEMWVWTARFAPKWLAAQPDPETLFRQIHDKVMATNRHQMNEMLANNRDRSNWLQASDQNLARAIRELRMPPAEVTEPVWDGYSDGFDPDEPPAFPFA